MIQFFESIKAWYVANQVTIGSLFDLLGFGSLGAVIVYIAKLITENKTGNKMVNKLAEAVKANEDGSLDTKNTLKNLASSSELVAKSIEVVSGALEKAEEKIDAIAEEVDNKFVAIENAQSAMFDLFSVVYSTIKDESVRTAAQNIITNAKYAKTTVKEEVQLQLETLKESLSKQVESMRTELNGVIDVTNNLIEPVKGVKIELDDAVKGVNRVG